MTNKPEYYETYHDQIKDALDHELCTAEELLDILLMIVSEDTLKETYARRFKN